MVTTVGILAMGGAQPRCGGETCLVLRRALVRGMAVGLMITFGERWDHWLEEDALKSRNSCLFYLSIINMVIVSYMYLLGWREGGNAWCGGGDCWHGRNSWCTSVVFFSYPLFCRLMWTRGGFGDFMSLPNTMLLVYTTFWLQGLPHDHTTFFWHKEVLLQVNIFVWRLLCNWLPTTDNLIRRRVLQSNAHYRSNGCGSSEDIDHLFLTCDFFGQICYEIFKWLGFVTVKAAHVKDHLLQFRSLDGFSKNICNAFYLTWLSFVWIVWQHKC